MRVHVGFKVGEVRQPDLTSVMAKVGPTNMDWLEFVFDDEEKEVRLMRHGPDYPDGGECVFSELVKQEEEIDEQQPSGT